MSTAAAVAGPAGVPLELGSIEINGVVFTPRADCKYQYDYLGIADDIARGKKPERETYATLVLDDLFFFVYFVIGIARANHPFVVKVCREVKAGPASHTFDVYAREHFKSTVFTIAETVQKVLDNQEERVAIFSYAKGPAVAFLRSIKQLLERSEFLKALFPHVLHEDPQRQAEKWSEEVGLTLKRRGTYKEATIEAHGLIEGMPTGKHFSHRVYDDIMTADFADSPEMISTVNFNFDMSQYLGTDEGTVRLVGTPYHDQDVIAYVKQKKKGDGSPLYLVREKPGTVNGLPNGEPVLLSQNRLEELRSDPVTFRSQILLDPVPSGEESLNPDFMVTVPPHVIPERLYKFMAIDPAGYRTADRRAGDSWAILVFGVRPYRDDLGLSELYVLDLMVEPMREDDALNNVVNMYMRAGRVLAIGVEKVGMMTAEIHVANALRARGKNISEDAGTLKVLRPAGRKKEQRIKQNLVWPLNNSKIHVSEAVPVVYRERLRTEMKRFPFWHDDGLDALSYAYDMIKDYRFSKYEEEEKPYEDLWARIRHKRSAPVEGWMVQ